MICINDEGLTSEQFERIKRTKKELIAVFKLSCPRNSMARNDSVGFRLCTHISFATERVDGYI